MSTTAGRIDLDLVLQSKAFKKQLNDAVSGSLKQMEKSVNRSTSGLTSGFKKLGGVMAAAFAVTQVAKFTSECLKLGSALTEVQNVVDVAFGDMSGQIDAFAENAITQFGLSETVAKRYAGIFGAMSKSFGYTNTEAVEMSKTLTGLAGDVASFYDISTDVAYTKLKSVFTGETEALKELGIVMTQAALDEFALSQGIAKTTRNMSEREKVALRYKFLQEKLTYATGDFLRTSDSWANQTRVLKLQFDALKASIGQGLINVLTPVVKWINMLLAKLNVLAKSFANFTAMITGTKQGSSKGAIAGAVAETGALTDGLGEAGAAAKKTAKEMKALMGFDELNVLNSNPDTGGDAAGAAIDFGNMDFGETIAEQEKISNIALDALKTRLKELADLFKDGFKAGLGEDFFSSLDRTKEHLQGIKNSLVEIANDPRVKESFNTMLDKMAYSSGQIVGSFASIGATIAENLTGGIDKYLQQDAPYIKDRLVGIFDNTGEIYEITGNLAQAWASIFEVFRSDEAKQVTANMIGVFSNAFLGVLDLSQRLGRDIVNMVAQPIIDNADKIKEALMNTIKPLETITGSINDFVKNTFDKIFEVYDAKVRPAFEGITAGISSIFSTALDMYNQHIAPVLQNFADAFDGLVKEKVQPAVDEFIVLFGNIAELIEVLWTNCLVPFFNWIMETIVPRLMPVIEAIGKVIMNVAGHIMDILQGLFKILSGIIEFVVGVFKGDWESAWNGIQKVFEGVWLAIKGFTGAILDSLFGIIEVALQAIKGIIQIAFDWIKETISNTYNKIKDINVAVWNFIVNLIKTTWTNIKTSVKDSMAAVKNTIVNGFNNAISYIKSLPKQALTWGKDIIMGMVNGIKSSIGNIKNAVRDVANTIRSFIHFSVPDTGPLTDYETYMPDMIEGLAKTLKSAAPILYKQVGDVAGNLSKGLKPELLISGYDFVRDNTPALSSTKIGESNRKEAVVTSGTQQTGAGQNFTLSELIAALRSLFPELKALLSLTVEIGEKEVFYAVKKVCDENMKRNGKNGL